MEVAAAQVACTPLHHILRHQCIKERPDDVRAAIFMFSCGAHRDKVAAIGRMAGWTDDHFLSVYRESLAIIKEASQNEALAPDPGTAPTENSR